jgi:hypothetical protein
MEQFDFDLMHAVLTEPIIHPETRDVVAPAGARFMDALPALIEVGADHVETSIGEITISEEIVQ